MSAQTTMQQLNATVQKLAKKDRPAAVALLAEFGVSTTPQLPADQYQAALDAFEEALSKLDAST
jgi:hypothetical protein